VTDDTSVYTVIVLNCTILHQGGAVFLSSGSSFDMSNSEMHTNTASNNVSAFAWIDHLRILYYREA
jgi:hypothetical protein